jgi:Zn2+/Cd2+-exporting ATPase
MTSLRHDAIRAGTRPATHAIGCAHCADEPAPTGANIRGWFTGIAATLVVIACGLSWITPFPQWSVPIFLAATLVGAVFPAQRAWHSIKRASLDINVLMVVAVAGALAIRQFEEAAMVVSLFAAAQWLEAQSLDRARQAIGKLIDLAPSTVLIRNDSGEHLVEIERVDPGTIMIVKPGEKIALDGIVRHGRSDVNQAPINGASLPAEKSEGDEVFAGTINGHGALTVAVTRRRADTTLARIVHLVESAQAKRAPMQQFIDRFAAWYTPSVVVLALLVASVPVIAFGQPLEVWLYRALVLLVVSCPCALVISTPVSIVSALAGAAQHGVLVKGGIHLERLAGVRVVAFDKTGTVTTGRLTLDAVCPLNGCTADDVVRLAASVESQSEHPIAAAIMASAHTRGVQLDVPSNVRALGIVARPRRTDAGHRPPWNVAGHRHAQRHRNRCARRHGSSEGGCGKRRLRSPRAGHFEGGDDHRRS